jgi:multicomponent Na+:H+ antiporter subunit B
VTKRALVLEVAVRALHPIMMVASVWVLFRGHHEPGGGFIGGLIAVCATALVAVAQGSGAAIARIPLGPTRLAALGVGLSLSSGIPALFVGRPYLTHLWVDVPLGFTELSLGTTLLFDVGVFAVVFGALGGVLASILAIDEEAGS